MPALDDLRVGARPARRSARPGRRVGAGPHLDRVRPRPAPARRQARRALWDGDDRAAGRLGRARERDPGRAVGRRLRAHRREVVLLGADERRVPGARAGSRRADVLPPAARARGRDAERLPDRPAQGQARQPLERLRRDPARGGRRAPGRRRGPRRRDDHRDGRPHAARLRPRLDGAHAPRGGGGDAPCGATAQRSGGGWSTSRSCRTCSPTCASTPRPRPRRRSAWRGPSTRATTRSGASRPRWRSTGSARRRRRSWPRRWNASVATATSRSPACRGSTARAR